MNSEYSESNRRRRIAIYIRVSTQEQKIEGYGLEAQKQKLLAYVNDNKGLNLMTKPEWFFEDVHTGSELSRPGLDALLERVKQKEFDAILVWKIDRLSRSLKHLLEIFETLQKAETSFISVQENIDFCGPIGQLIFQIFGAIAQFERELIKTRTRGGIIASAELGNFTGTTIPYGFKAVANPSGKGKKLATIPAEKKWIEKIFEWYIFEEMGYMQIAKKLNILKVPRGQCAKPSEQSKRWTNRHIETIIQHPIYRGEYLANCKDEYGKLLREDQWTVVSVPPCVSELVFLMAQHKRNERSGATQSTHVYLLSTKLFDTTTSPNKKFTGCKRYKGGRSYRRKQFKRDGQHHSVFEIPCEPLEKAIWEKVKFALRSPEPFIKQYLNEEVVESRLDDISQELSSLREQRINIELRASRIELAYEEGSYTREAMDSKIERINAELSEIDKRSKRLTDELHTAGMAHKEAEGIRRASKLVQLNLDNISRKQQKILIDLFVDRVELHRKPIDSDGIQQQWETTVTVFFRFVPDSILTPSKVGRTTCAGNTHDYDGLVRKNPLPGGRAYCGYNSIRCKFEVKKRAFFKQGAGITNTVKKIVLEEPILRKNSFEKY